MERGGRVPGRGAETGIVTIQPSAAVGSLVRALRPTQWLKNGVLFAGLIFGGKLFDLAALASAMAAALLFCLLSSGFYLINDVRDIEADRAHPVKRKRPIAADELSTKSALAVGATFILLSIAGAYVLSPSFALWALVYTGLMAAYNLGLKEIVIVDVFVIAAGFVIRAAAGAVAVSVAISPWLLLCTMLLALLIGFGKRRSELVLLDNAVRHRGTLESYSRMLLDQAVAVTAAGSLLGYAVYTVDADTPSQDQGMVLTVPFVAYGIFRYLYLVYRRDEGGAPETMFLADRGMLASVFLWGIVSAMVFYF